MEMKIDVIRRIVEKHSQLDLSNSSRVRNLVYTRALYFKLCRTYTLYPLSVIGESVGKDHATVLHGLKLFDQWIAEREKDYMVQFKKMDKDVRKKYSVRKTGIKTREYYRLKCFSLINKHRALMRKHRNLKKILDI